MIAIKTGESVTFVHTIRINKLEANLAACLKNDGFFMAMYGNLLKRAQMYEEANKILVECTRLQPMSNIYLDMGDCYKQLGQYKKAEDAYVYSLRMVPSRIKPISSLAQLYLDIEKEDKALQIIDYYLNCENKKRTISSYEIELKLLEMRNQLKPN